MDPPLRSGDGPFLVSGFRVDLKRSWRQRFCCCAAIAAAGSRAESIPELGNHNIVSEGTQYPDGVEQMRRFGSQFGGSSPDLGGNLQPNSLSCEAPCGPYSFLDPARARPLNNFAL